jgi:hypothetical protein
MSDTLKAPDILELVFTLNQTNAKRLQNEPQS